MKICLSGGGAEEGEVEVNYKNEDSYPEVASDQLEQTIQLVETKPKSKQNKVMHAFDDELNSRRVQYGTQSIENTCMNDFKHRLVRVANLTPEAFFRVCDYSYQKEVSTEDFKNKLKKL